MMTSQTPSQRYSTPSIAMHWAMVALFVAVYALINVAEGFEKGSAGRQMARDWHFTFGLLIFALVWARIALRVLGTTPPIQPAPTALMEKLAKLGHLARPDRTRQGTGPPAQGYPRTGWQRRLFSDWWPRGCRPAAPLRVEGQHAAPHGFGTPDLIGWPPCAGIRTDHFDLPG